MVDSVLFIGAIIAGITQFIKSLSPKVAGPVTVVVAVLVGILVAIVDKEVGVADITVAQGIMTAFGVAGVVSTAQNVGVKSETKLDDIKDIK